MPEGRDANSLMRAHGALDTTAPAFGAIFPVIVADLMRNTDRFNVAQGAIITAQTIGAGMSTTLAGLIVVKAGYSAAFLTLGAVAAIGFVACWFALSEPALTLAQTCRGRQ